MTWRHWRRGAAETLGRRGAFLLMFGLAYSVYGVAQLVRSTTPFAGLGVYGELLAQPPWGVVWATCGVAAIGCGLWRSRVGVDQLGYNALLVPPSVWTLGYTWSAILYLGTGGAAGAERAWASAVIWSALVVSVLVVSGWPEAPRGPQDPST